MAKRLRTIIKRLLLHNKWNDGKLDSNATELNYDLTDEGGIQEHEVTHLVAQQCGHFAEAAGLCSVCERIVCPACMFTCEDCAKPIGRCHAIEVDGKWYCTECRAAQIRRSITKRVLSPLVRFNDEETP